MAFSRMRTHHLLCMTLCLVADSAMASDDGALREIGKLPAHWDAKNKDPLINARLGPGFCNEDQVWRVGGGFFTQEAWERALKADYVFRGIDKYTASFLSSSLNVKVAVQFGCFRLATPYEDALVEALEDFTGPKANQALASCLLGWQDGAWERAGNALVKRDKQLLIKVLLQGKVPPICRYYQSILLARCNHPSAVPILCDEVRKYAMIDIEMFTHIARLGNPEHADLIRCP